MKLRLMFPPTPEFAAKHAELMVRTAKEISGVDLDFTPGSLVAVDEIVEQFRQDGITEQQIGETLFGFGCYVGEVLVRQNGAVWRASEDTPMRDSAGFQMVVDLGSEKFCNPIGKVFKRLKNGPEDSLPYFYQVFTQRDQPTISSTDEGPRKPGFWRRMLGK
jgi:uncharacterized protein DUF6278